MAVLAIVASMVVACGSSSPSATPGGSRSADEPVGPSLTSGPGPSADVPSAAPAEVSAARDALRAVDLADDATVDAAAAIRYTAAAAEAARSVLETGTADDATWAAVWVYATSGNDPAPLLPFTSSEDPSIAVMAAAGLVALGERAGFDGLTRQLSATATLRGSHPPATVDVFAAATLYRYVAADDAPSITGETPPSDVAESWRTWLAANQASLVFDEATARWSLP